MLRDRFFIPGFKEARMCKGQVPLQRVVENQSTRVGSRYGDADGGGCGCGCGCRMYAIEFPQARSRSRGRDRETRRSEMLGM